MVGEDAVDMNLAELLTRTQTEDYNNLSLEGKRIFLQGFFKRDFSAFVYLLGYRDVGEFHAAELKKLGGFRYIQPNPVRNLWIWSRGFFKTSLITEAHSLWLIVNNPNIRILLVSFSLSVAMKPFAAIRNQFTLNSDFRYFFREFCPIASKDGKVEFGTTEHFTIPNRTKGLKEPTMMCAGVGTNVTGLHFDWMKLDDLVTKDSVTNDTQVQSSKDYYSLLRPIHDNPTCPREDVIGTIYHFNDLHCNMQKNPEFKQSFIPVTKKDGSYVFHERINEEGFKSICNDPSMNPYDIQSQYHLNPIDPSQRRFKDEWIKYYDTLPAGLSEYILCDPASTKKKTSDYTVIQRWGVDSDSNIYLLDGLRDRLSSNERVDAYTGMAKQAGLLRGARYEVLGGRHGDLENIRLRWLDERMPIEAHETKATTASKQDRIEQRLVGQFHAGKVFIPRSLPRIYRFNGKKYDFVYEFLLEYRQFPFSEHDDILDCHSQLFDGSFLIKGSKKAVRVEKDDEFDWWRNLAIKANRKNRSRFVFGNKGRTFGVPAKESLR